MLTVIATVADAVSVSTQDMSTFFKRHVDLSLVTGVQIRSVGSLRLLELLSTASSACLPHMMDKLTGTFTHALAWAHAIKMEQTAAAVDAPTGKKKESQSLHSLTLRDARTRTQSGRTESRLPYHGSRGPVPLLTHTPSMT